jgi:hypothetical protein
MRWEESVARKGGLVIYRANVNAHVSDRTAPISCFYGVRLDTCKGKKG